ncbi:MAG: hypothetical protein JO051_06175 [Acidobacteriaceae bacterium]|nr:hypothetical protein [Acidobacteriaceae bacterium]
MRHTETFVKWIMAPERSTAIKPPLETVEDPNERAAIEELEAALGTKVRLKRKPNGSGRLEVEFYSADDLDRIYSVITKQ